MGAKDTFYKGDWVLVEDRTGVRIEAQVEETLKRYESKNNRRLLLRYSFDETLAIDVSFWTITILRRNLVKYDIERPGASQEKHTL